MDDGYDGYFVLVVNVIYMLWPYERVYL